ncbi:MAG TPA: ABC transporter permease [Phycisphaerales bacterium]|nr:ABC transporter permease [Phycisphaerales bacterium]
MVHVALRMLFGDRAKYLTLVLGLAFAALLMNQQGAIFMGLLNQATGPLQNVTQPDLWVTDPGTKWVAEYRSLSDQKVGRVRSVPGVEWAEPFFNAWAVVELKNGDFKRVQLMGVPRTTLVGRPAVVTRGRIEDLWIPDAIMVDENSAPMLGNPEIGDVLKMNDRRALVVGFCKAKRGFESNAIVYTTFDRAQEYSPVGRKRTSYILVKVKPDADVATVQAEINRIADVAAFTPQEFRKRSIEFIVTATGIGVNFGITITLGFVVGVLLSASVFYQFTLENLRHFAVLRAMGTQTRALVGMVLVQALVVAVVGYGIGAGVAGAFAIMSQKIESDLATYFPWQLLVGSFFATLFTIGVGSLLSLRRVLRINVGTVFGA